MVLIPYGMKYTSTMTGQAPKFVTCEKCAYQYVYLIQAVESASSTDVLFLQKDKTIEESRAMAQRLVEQTLDHAVEVVPCSKCGHIQSHMFPRARFLHLAWMRKAAVICGIGGLILMLPALLWAFAIDPLDGRHFSKFTLVLWSLVLLMFTLAGSFFLARTKGMSRFDPNAAPVETRKQSGADQSVSLEEFSQIEESRRRR